MARPLDRADLQARLAERRAPATRAQRTARSRSTGGVAAPLSVCAPWIPWRANAGADRPADGSAGVRPEWNDANCAQRHFAPRARLGGEAGRRDGFAGAIPGGLGAPACVPRAGLRRGRGGVDGRRPAALFSCATSGSTCAVRGTGVAGAEPPREGVCGGDPAAERGGSDTPGGIHSTTTDGIVGALIGCCRRVTPYWPQEERRSRCFTP